MKLLHQTWSMRHNCQLSANTPEIGPYDLSFGILPHLTRRHPFWGGELETAMFFPLRVEYPWEKNE